MNYVGARPHGVNLFRILQEMGLAGDRNLAGWTRTDMSSRTRRTTRKCGPVWGEVVARVTADAVSGKILDSELTRDITRSLDHIPLERGHRDIQTILVFEASKVKSSSQILQDSVLESDCVDMENKMTGIPVTTESKHLVGGPCWSLNCLNPCFLAVAMMFRVNRN